MVLSQRDLALGQLHFRPWISPLGSPDSSRLLPRNNKVCFRAHCIAQHVEDKLRAPYSLSRILLVFQY